VHSPADCTDPSPRKQRGPQDDIAHQSLHQQPQTRQAGTLDKPVIPTGAAPRAKQRARRSGGTRCLSRPDSMCENRGNQTPKPALSEVEGQARGKSARIGTSPAGTKEHSPALQRWVGWTVLEEVPEGRQKRKAKTIRTARDTQPAPRAVILSETFFVSRRICALPGRLHRSFGPQTTRTSG
jgi:hypothetical protein